MTVVRRVAGGIAATAAALALTAAPTPAVADDDDAEGTTTVVLDQRLVPALLGLGVQPIRPGTLTAPGGVAQVAFPITEVDDGVIEHSGGLMFTKAAAGNVRIKSFDVDPAAGVLTARTKVAGQHVGRIPVFTLGAVMPVNATGTVPGCDGVAAGLYLTEAAGAALGVPAGTFIGDACVVPELDDDDGDDDDDDDGDDD
ncbi:MAG TPA: hypothetical protein VFV76_16935 [Actinomycetes bacterium]|nr:hypothetical protein [Actinomycetes bacterium]